MKIWVLGDDRVGNTHQAIALAEKLFGDYILIKLKYNSFAKLPNFLLKYYPIHVKKDTLRDILDKSLPDVIITAGRRTAVLAYHLKKISGGKIKLLQIMQPSLPYEAFEAVILPFHDFGLSSCESSCVVPAKAGIQKNNLSIDNFSILNWIPRSSRGMTAVGEMSNGNDILQNIIPINGALNNVTEKFAAANLELKKHYPKLKKFIAVIIGGNSKKFNFTEKEAALFSSLLKKIYDNQKIPFFISFSRRTPDSVKSIIKNNMPASTIIYDPTIDLGGFNPYIAMLANAKCIISTADSISMCSEAASSGKPLYIFCPANFSSRKHKVFTKQLVEQKIAKIFDESIISLEEYNYKPLNETERVAEIIRILLKS